MTSTGAFVKKIRTIFLTTILLLINWSISSGQNINSSNIDTSQLILNTIRDFSRPRQSSHHDKVFLTSSANFALSELTDSLKIIYTNEKDYKRTRKLIRKYGRLQLIIVSSFSFSFMDGCVYIGFNYSDCYPSNPDETFGIRASCTFTYKIDSISHALIYEESSCGIQL